MTDMDGMSAQRATNQHQQFVSALAEKEQKLADDTDALAKRVSALVENMEIKYKDLYQAQNAVVEQKYGQVAQLVSDVEAKHTQLIADLDQSLERKCAEHGNELQALREQGDVAQAEIRRLHGQMERTVSEARAGLEERIDNNHAHLTQVCAKLERDVADNYDSQEERAKNNYDYFDQRVERLDRSIQDNATEAHRHVESSCGALESRLTEARSIWDTELDRLKQQTAEDLKTAEVQLEGHIATCDKRFTVRADGLEARLAQHATQSSGALDVLGSDLRKLEQHVRAQNLIQDERAAEQHEQLALACRDIGEQLVAHSNSLDNKWAESKEAQNERLDEISAIVEEHHQHFSDVCSSINKAQGQQSKVVDDALAEIRTEFSTRTTSLTESLSNKWEVLAARVENYRSHFTELYSTVDETASAAATHLDKKFTELCALQENKFTERCAANTARIDSEHAHFQELCNFIERKATDNTKAVEMKLERAHDSTMKSLTARCDELQQLCDVSDAKFSQETATLRAELSADVLTLGQRLSEKNAAQDERLDELNGTVHEHHEHFTTVCVKLDTKFSEMGAEQQAAAERHEQHVAELCSKLEHRLADDMSHLTGRVDNNHTHLKGICTNISSRCADNIQDLDKKFSDSCGRIEAKVLASVTELVSSIESVKGHATEIGANIDHKYTELLAELDEKFTMKGREQDSRADQLSAAVGEHHEHFTNLCSQLNRNFSQKDKALQELVEDYRQYFTTQITRVERKSSDECASIETKLSERGASLEERADELSSVVEEHHDHFTTVFAHLDRRFNERHSQHDEREKELHAHFVTTTGKLQGQIDRETAAQSERLEAYREQTVTLAAELEEKASISHTQLDKKFTDVCEALDTKLTSAALEHEKRHDEGIAKVQQQVEDQAASVAQQITGIVKDSEAHHVELVARHEELFGIVEEHHSHFTEIGGRLDSKFSAIAQEQSSQLAAEHEYLTEICGGLERKVSETTEALDKRFTAKIFEQEERLDGLINDAADTHAHFTTVCSTLDRKYQDKTAAADAALEDQRQYFTTVSGKLDRRLTEAETELKEQIGSIEADLTAQCASLRERLASGLDGVDVKFTAAIQHLDRSFSEKSDSLSKQLEQEHRFVVDANSKMDGKWLDRHTAAEQRSTEQFAGLTAQLEEVATSVQEHHAHFSDVCARQASKTSEKQEAVDDTIAQHYQHFSSKMAKTVNTFSTELAELEQRFKTGAASSEHRMDTLSVTVAEHRELADSASERLEKRLTEQGERLSKGLADAVSKAKALETRILSNVGTRALDLDQEILSLDSIASASKRQQASAAGF
eukprot:SAG31_NODE_2100_length_6446_cov_2.680006_1_plen_1324_part_10